MTGQLFTQYFLTDGIRATPEWRASLSHTDAFAAFRAGLRCVFETFSRFTSPNEAVTEQDCIRPVLALLGWTDFLPQQGATAETTKKAPTGRWSTDDFGERIASLLNRGYQPRDHEESGAAVRPQWVTEPPA